MYLLPKQTLALLPVNLYLSEDELQSAKSTTYVYHKNAYLAGGGGDWGIGISNNAKYCQEIGNVVLFTEFLLC